MFFLTLHEPCEFYSVSEARLCEFNQIMTVVLLKRRKMMDVIFVVFTQRKRSIVRENIDKFIGFY
jgi:hypothetical protein